MLFFGSPKIDLQIILFFLGVSFVISLIVLAFVKRKLLAIVVFSVLGNIIFFLASFTGSEVFRVYHFLWLEYFSVIVWPFLNIYAVYKLAKSKK